MTPEQLLEALTHFRVDVDEAIYEAGENPRTTAAKTKAHLIAVLNELLPDDLIVKDEPAAAPDKEWTPKVGDRIVSKYGTHGTLSGVRHFNVLWDEGDNEYYSAAQLKKFCQPE